MSTSFKAKLIEVGISDIQQMSKGDSRSTILVRIARLTYDVLLILSIMRHTFVKPMHLGGRDFWKADLEEDF